MRFGVVSDIHGNLPALLAVVADAQALGGVDAWLDLGDIVSGPLWPVETAEWLMAREADSTPPWHTMAGNHERQVLNSDLDRMSPTDRFAAERLLPAQRAWLAALPARLQPAPGLLCVHGTAGSDLEYLLHTVTPQGLRDAYEDELAARLHDVPDARDPNTGPVTLLLCGHSHLPRDVHVAGLRIANPGSVGLPAYDDDHPWPHVVENGTPQARYAVVLQAGDAWQVELRCVGYDWAAATARAAANGRGDWADALASGRVGRRERDVIG